MIAKEKISSSQETGDKIISLVDRDLIINRELSGLDFGVYLGNVLNAYTNMQYRRFEQGRDYVMWIALISLKETRDYLEERLGKNVSFRNTKRAGVLVPHLIGYTDEGFREQLDRIDEYAAEIATTERALKDIDINSEAIACLTNFLRRPLRF